MAKKRKIWVLTVTENQCDNEHYMGDQIIATTWEQVVEGVKKLFNVEDGDFHKVTVNDDLSVDEMYDDEEKHYDNYVEFMYEGLSGGPNVYRLDVREFEVGGPVKVSPGHTFESDEDPNFTFADGFDND